MEAEGCHLRDRYQDRYQNDAGFSLVEVVLVILLVGILGVVATFLISNIRVVKLHNATGKAVADLRYAQQLAITTRTRHGLTVNSTQQYTGHVDNAGIDTPIPDPTNLGQNFIVDFDTYRQGEFSGVRFSAAAPFCEDAACGGTCRSVVEFDRMGAPTDTAGNPMCRLTVVLTHPGAPNETITIETNTGKVSN